jgi:uncharacterized protein
VVTGDSVPVPNPGSAAPLRTCIGCRGRAAKSELLRVVVLDGGLVPDPTGRRPGRGAYLHRSPECLQAAQRRRAFPRALRVSGPLDVGGVTDWFTAADTGHQSSTSSPGAGREPMTPR